MNNISTQSSSINTQMQSIQEAERLKNSFLQQKRFKNYNPLNDLLIKEQDKGNVSKAHYVNLTSENNNYSSIKLSSMSYIEYKQNNFNNAYIPVLPLKLIKK